ncbi:MAG TPA: hypothetical protein VGF48_16630 [Thermoanaerobaculia bacterium]|jgi:hypothetical protein
MRKAILVAFLLLVLMAVPRDAAAGCDYSCDQGYDTAQCWLWLSGNIGNMTSCTEVCDCMGWYCSCWCSGPGCYWT